MEQKKFLLLFVVIFASTSFLYSQGLNSIHTPDGVNIIAVGNLGKIYRSSNAGNTWASYIYNSTSMKSVFSFGNSVWIAGESGNVYKTTKVISPINTHNVGESFTINSICFVDENTGFLCGDNGKVYKSLNGGVSWILSNTGVETVKLNSISFKDASKGITVGDNGKIYITDNGGTSWTLQSLNVTRNLLRVKFFNDGIIIAGEYGTLIRKVNEGTWNSITTRTNSDIHGVTGSSINDARVCGGGGFIRNNLNGRENFFNFEVNPMLANLVDIMYYNSDVGFAVSSLNNAIIKTTNAGQTWQLPAGTNVTYQWQSKLTSTSGIGNNLCQHPTDRNTMFVAYGSRIFVSRNRGENWSQIATMTGTGITNGRAHSFYVSPLDTNVWVAAIDNVSPDKVVRTTDYGVTWSISHSQNFSAYGQPMEMDQNNPNIYYFVPDGGGFWKSTNGGANFTQISAYPFLSPCDIVVMWDSSNVLYVGESSPSRVYKSVDGGANWTLVLTSTGSEIPSMANSVFDRSLGYATTFSSLIWKTTNYGSNWINVATQTGSGWGSDICREDPTVYLYATYSGSTGYLTTNSGANFTSTSISGGGSNAGIIVPERSYLLSQQTSGLFKMNITYSVLTSVNENIISSVTPTHFKLYQNFPNPFNPSTSIRFDLPFTGNVSLKIYDQLGKEIKILAAGVKNIGSYEINFEASDLSSGIYFYSLEIDGNKIDTKKMILVK